MTKRKALLRLEEEIGKAHYALDDGDVERYHGQMAIVASIAMSESQPRAAVRAAKEAAE